MSELLMSQLAATNMVYKKFSFDYFLDSCDRLGIHQLELYGWFTDWNYMGAAIISICMTVIPIWLPICEKNCQRGDLVLFL